MVSATLYMSGTLSYSPLSVLRHTAIVPRVLQLLLESASEVVGKGRSRFGRNSDGFGMCRTSPE